MIIQNKRDKNPFYRKSHIPNILRPKFTKQKIHVTEYGLLNMVKQINDENLKKNNFKISHKRTRSDKSLSSRSGTRLKSGISHSINSSSVIHREEPSIDLKSRRSKANFLRSQILVPKNKGNQSSQLFGEDLSEYSGKAYLNSKSKNQKYYQLEAKYKSNFIKDLISLPRKRAQISDFSKLVKPNSRKARLSKNLLATIPGKNMRSSVFLNSLKSIGGRGGGKSRQSAFFNKIDNRVMLKNVIFEGGDFEAQLKKLGLQLEKKDEKIKQDRKKTILYQKFTSRYKVQQNLIAKRASSNISNRSNNFTFREIQKSFNNCRTIIDKHSQISFRESLRNRKTFQGKVEQIRSRSSLERKKKEILLN